jgi:hypothetical protein
LDDIFGSAINLILVVGCLMAINKLQRRTMTILDPLRLLWLHLLLLSYCLQAPVFLGAHSFLLCGRACIFV